MHSNYVFRYLIVKSKNLNFTSNSIIREKNKFFYYYENSENNLFLKEFELSHHGPDKTKLSDGESWKTYSDGQPLSKSRCIRVYLDKKKESA